MSYKIGYKQRRSRTITPDRQAQELNDYGVDVIYDDLDEAIAAGGIRKGDMLCVWNMGIIGRARIHEVFLAMAKGGGAGIYSIKCKTLYPSSLPHAQHIHDAIQEIKGVEDKARSGATKDKSGRHKSTVWLHADRVNELYGDGMHIDDLAEKFKCGSSTIRRIIDGVEIK